MSLFTRLLRHAIKSRFIEDIGVSKFVFYVLKYIILYCNNILSLFLTQFTYKRIKNVIYYNLNTYVHGQYENKKRKEGKKRRKKKEEKKGTEVIFLLFLKCTVSSIASRFQLSFCSHYSLVECFDLVTLNVQR